MTLHVDADSIINDVQEKFNYLFPDLKLEFFFSTKERFTPSSHLKHSFPFIRIGELCDHCRRTFLDITDNMTVSELENQFREQFGLPAQIYMKDGDYWLKNPTVGKCTLKH